MTKLSPAELALFHAALHEHTRREWRSKKDRAAPRYSFAVLFDQNENLPPTSFSSLKHWARIAEKLGVEVEPITKRDQRRPSSTRCSSATTWIDNTPNRFARRRCRRACRSSTTRSR